jgi:hypothetical protein
MSGAMVGEEGTGTTTINSGGALQVLGNAHIRQRILTIKGYAYWATVDGARINLEQNAKINIAGGELHILTLNSAGIASPDQSEEASVTVSNGGLFHQQYLEQISDGMTQVGVTFRNDNARVNIEGAVAWTRVGGVPFSQTGTNAITILGAATYDLSRARFSGGTLRLLGGTLTLPNNRNDMVDVKFELSGQTSGIYATNASIYLLDNLTVTGGCELRGTEVHLGGNTLTVQGGMDEDAATFFFLENGSISTTDFLQIRRTRIRGSGTVNGVQFN